jgi:hypothetical protein
MIVLDFSDLAEVHRVYGRRPTAALLAHIGARLKLLAGAHGFAMRTERCRFAVLLPGLSREAAAVRMERTLGKPCAVEFEAAEGDAIVLVPEWVNRSTNAATGAQALYGQLCRDLDRAGLRIPVPAIPQLRPASPADREALLPEPWQGQHHGWACPTMPAALRPM